jgi:hypothetical protein
VRKPGQVWNLAYPFWWQLIARGNLSVRAAERVARPTTAFRVALKRVLLVDTRRRKVGLPWRLYPLRVRKGLDK